MDGDLGECQVQDNDTKIKRFQNMSSNAQIREAEDARDEAASQIAQKLPLKSKLANCTLLIVNLLFFMMGLAFTAGASGLLSISDQFYGNDTFKLQLVIGLRLALSTGVFLVVLSLLGCLSTCRVSPIGLGIYTALLSTVIILQVSAVAIMFLFGASIASMEIGGPSFRWQNGTIKRQW